MNISLLKNNWTRSAACFLGLGLTLGASAAETPEWVERWNKFAQETGEARHAEWAAKISDPEALKLAQDWEAFRGYTASSLIEAADLPEELREGLVLNKDNIDAYPWLTDYLPQAKIDRLKDSEWFNWGQIVVSPTNHYYMSRGRLEETKKSIKEGSNFSLTEKGEILDSDGKYALINQAAMPFTTPKNGSELNALQTAYGVGNENLMFDPMTVNVCNKSNKAERVYEAKLWWQKMHGRVAVAPLGDIEDREEIVEGGAIFFLKPFDVRGTAVTRMRYAETDKEDDFHAFLPSLRRTRVLAGSDAQDPLAAGFEVTWDDWRQSWTKTDPRKFDYEMTGEGFVLTQGETGLVYNPATLDDTKCQIASIEMELRPVWILEITDKTGKYVYGKRRLYIDKESYSIQYQELYDPRGNLMRLVDDARDWDPKTGLAMWRNFLVWNVISKRANILEMDSRWDIVNEDISGIFDIDLLRDYR
jgi:hypothetical protein